MQAFLIILSFRENNFSTFTESNIKKNWIGTNMNFMVLQFEISLSISSYSHYRNFERRFSRLRRTKWKWFINSQNINQRMCNVYPYSHFYHRDMKVRMLFFFKCTHVKLTLQGLEKPIVEWHFTSIATMGFVIFTRSIRVRHLNLQLHSFVLVMICNGSVNFWRWNCNSVCCNAF